MAAYKQIREWIKSQEHFTVKIRWIADVKERCGLPLRKAPDRIDENERANPCPQDKIEPIKRAFRHYGMIV